MTQDVPVAPPSCTRLVDVALVVLPILAVVILGTIHIPVDADDRPMDALAYACGIVGTLSLVFWRHWPVAVVGVVAVTTAVYVGRGVRRWPGAAAGTAGTARPRLHHAASRRLDRCRWLRRGRRVVRLAVGDAEIGELLILVGWASAAVLAGQAIAARAERTATERERRAHAQEQALANERLRIARICTTRSPTRWRRSTCSRASPPTSSTATPAQAKQAFEAIRAASSDALDELTAILVGAAQRGSRRRRAARADRHVGRDRRARRAGPLGRPHRRRSTSTAMSSTLGPSVSSAAYRVVQEALTNTRRHAGFVGSRTGRRLGHRTWTW